MVKAELLSCGSLWGIPCAPNYSSSFFPCCFPPWGNSVAFFFLSFFFFLITFGCAGSLLLHAGFL